jgi:O-glycosyl hydrolase
MKNASFAGFLAVAFFALAAFPLTAQQLVIVDDDDRPVSNLELTVSFILGDSFHRASIHHELFNQFITDDLVIASAPGGRGSASISNADMEPPKGPATLALRERDARSITDLKVNLRFMAGNEPYATAFFVPALTNVALDLNVHGGTRIGKIWSGNYLRPMDHTVQINPLNVLVEGFQGWGVSLCWWANVVGGFSNRNDYADMIFNTLKLNIVRYNIGGGEGTNGPGTLQFRAAIPGFEPSRYNWNWDADQNQRWMLKAALARGADRVEAFANSPPSWMTVSGSVTGGRDGAANLPISDEQDFAIYLAEVLQHLSQSDGVTFASITPLNEPSSLWWKYGNHQEGCHVEADQQERVITLLRAELNTRGLHALIDAPEDNDEQSGIKDLGNYSAAGLKDVGQISTHTYGANNPEGLRLLARQLRKPLRQTEYGDGDRTGLKLARRICRDLAELRPLSWCYWQAVDYDGWGLLYNPLEQGGPQNFFVTQKFYAFEQFTRFLRPGCRIVSCGDRNSIAGYDPNSQTLAIVTVNDSMVDFTVTYALSDFAATGATAQAYRTSEHEAVQELSPLTVATRSFSSVILARSVTTFVLQHVTLN